VTETVTTPTVLDPDWHLRAACRGADSELFFAWSGTTLAKRVIAYYCDPCPVRNDCLADELRRPAADRRGIRGGVHFGQRSR
jgi:hypothetical protein